MKTICSLMFLSLLVASVSQGAQSPQELTEFKMERQHPVTPTQERGEDDWGHTGDTPPPDAERAPSPPPVLGTAIGGGLLAPVPLPALLPEPPAGGNPEENSWGVLADVAGWVTTAVGWGLWYDEPAGAGGESEDSGGAEPGPVPAGAVPHVEAALLEAVPSNGPAGVTAPVGAAAVVPPVPEVPWGTLNEYCGADPLIEGGIQTNPLDVFAAEGARLAVWWANREKAGRALFPDDVQLASGLELTKGLLTSIGFSGILQGWTVSNVEVRLVSTGVMAALSNSLGLSDEDVPPDLCSLTLIAPNGFKLSCISAPEPRTVKELVLDMMTVINPENILEEGRNRVLGVYDAQRVDNRVLRDMGLLGQELGVDHKPKVDKRMEYIRAFLSSNRPHAVAGNLGVGSLLVALSRQREGRADQVPYVYGFSTWEAIQDGVMWGEENPDLLPGRERAYRQFGRMRQLSQPQPTPFGTRLLLPDMPIPARPGAQLARPLPAEEGLFDWVYNMNLSAFLSYNYWATWFQGWENFNFWQAIGYVAVQSESAEELSRRILGDMSIFHMGRDILAIHRHQIAPIQEAASVGEVSTSGTHLRRRLRVAVEAVPSSAAVKPETYSEWT